AHPLKCADGRRATTCPVGRVHFQNLAESAQNDANRAFYRGEAIFNGKITTETVGAHIETVLSVSEVWMGQTGAVPHDMDSVYTVQSTPPHCLNGANCVTAHEALVNPSNDIQATGESINGVDFSLTSASDAQISAAKDAMQNGNILVAGMNRGIAGHVP